jgi:predicted short-subunit dehydrogenase-like oxidoreductase (DUF2520 family)
VSRKPSEANVAAKSAGGSQTSKRPTIAIVGAGSLASFLAIALDRAGFEIKEIIARDLPGSLQRARSLAAKVGADAVTAHSASLNATVLWVCVPDREIHSAALGLADRLRILASTDQRASLKVKLEDSVKSGVKEKLQAGRLQAGELQAGIKSRFAFHSSGALLSGELEPLRQFGIGTASVHPLMTFVRGARPSLEDVPFAVEGDAAAKRVANQIIRILGGKTFSLPAKRKSAYHAWATMTSPLFLAFLVTLEEAARAAGLTREEARGMSLPIIRQTLTNYSPLGPAQSFSGPFVRGDAETVARHLEELKKRPGAREVYIALARAALRGLPIKNREQLKRLLKG